MKIGRRTNKAITLAGKVALKAMPDRVPVTFAGDNSLALLADAIGHDGGRRTLIVTDKVLVELGLVGRLTEVLDERSIAYEIFDEVEPDPTWTQCRDGVDRFRTTGCDNVVAFGGGSSIDAAKTIAAGATQKKPVEKLSGRMTVRGKPAPLYAVPTTSGTGSEVSVGAVISDPETHQKSMILDAKLAPRAVALDARLTVGLPPGGTAATGMDALTHAVESYISQLAGPESQAHAISAVRMIFESLPAAYKNGEDLHARNEMLMASYYAARAFNRTSLGYVHAIAHAVGARYGVPHGMANSLVLPHVLDYSLPDIEDELRALGAVIGLDPDSRGADFIAAVRDLRATVGLPEHLDALEADAIPELAEQALAEAHVNYAVPRFMEPADCEALIAKLAPPESDAGSSL